MELRAPTPLLTVSAPPHVHCGRTLRGAHLEILLALLPAAVMAVVHFGLPAFRVMALSASVAVAVEALCFKAMGKPSRVDDYSALVTGLLFAFLLPASAPWWLVAIGSAITVALGKMAFGGLGAEPLCPPLVGWAVCKISWPGALDVDLTMLDTTLVNPVSQLKYFGVDAASALTPVQMLAGEQLAGLGAAQVGALALGGLYLCLRGRIKWRVPAAMLAAVFATSLLYNLADPGLYPAPWFNLLAGSTVLGAFFLATDNGSSPMGAAAAWLYGAFAGILVVIIRVYGVYPDGVAFAVLLANLAGPLFDRIRPKPFGKGKR